MHLNSLKNHFNILYSTVVLLCFQVLEVCSVSPEVLCYIWSSAVWITSVFLIVDHLEISLSSTQVWRIFSAFCNDLLHCLWSVCILWARAAQNITRTVAMKRRCHLLGRIRRLSCSWWCRHRQRKVHHVEHAAQAPRYLQRKASNNTNYYFKYANSTRCPV